MKRDARNYCFIKLTKGPAPKFVVVRGAGTDDSSIYYGPFMGAMGVGEAVRELNDVLGLRDCAIDQKMHFADQPELFDIMPRTPGCIRFEVRKCLGPCVGGCTVQQYDERLALARGFLDGTDDGPIEHLRSEMEEASERMEYERAAVLRDKFKRLEALRGQFGRLRFAVETLSFAYTVPGHDGDDRVYLIRRGRVRAETTVPRTPADALALMTMIDGVFTPVERETNQIPTHEIDELLLLSSWFRRFPGELERTSAGATPLGLAS
jgi:excinuclease ABC subunit C